MDERRDLTSPGFEDAIGVLGHAASYRRIYFREHPRVAALAEEFCRRLEVLLVAPQRTTFFLGLAGGKLIHDGRALVGSTIVAKRLIEQLEALGSGGVLFRRGTRAEELLELLEPVRGSGESARDLREARERLRSCHALHLELSAPYASPEWLGQKYFSSVETDDATGEPSDEPLVPVYQQLFGTVEEAHLRGASGSDVGVDSARSASEKLQRAVRGDFRDLLQLVRYSDYDSFTVGHSVRVATLAVLVGHAHGFDERTLTELGAAGLLHDVGKALIPEEILFKPAALDDEERRIMKRHPQLGAELLLESASAGQMAIGAAWGHHLRHDGGGYPAHRPWAVRSQLTALIQVCDIFEALTAARPYKRALSPQRAYEILLADRGALDPRALAALVRTLGFYPPGSHVELDTGEQGLVIAAGSAVDRPRIELQRDASGRALPADERVRLDLGAREHGERRVVKLLDAALATSAEEEREVAFEALAALPCGPCDAHEDE
ncbi:MAG: HD domain-containing protein [Planctomycetes bacterium]|nr:HD domain-containing protein [Planctomycetota bacterium]